MNQLQNKKSRLQLFVSDQTTKTASSANSFSVGIKIRMQKLSIIIIIILTEIMNHTTITWSVYIVQPVA